MKDKKVKQVSVYNTEAHIVFCHFSSFGYSENNKSYDEFCYDATMQKQCF